MFTNAYRLGDYKIMEAATGELRWEAHYGFAQFQVGRCFTKGTILFIWPAENDLTGFLRAEFLDHIKAFPTWPKTRYYCRDFEIYNCRTGKRVTKQDMLMRMSSPSRRLGTTAQKEGAFKLGRYEITRKTTGQIVWKMGLGPNTVRKGTCTVLEDILFFEPRETTESTLIERRFRENPAQLPKWDQTEYYARRSSLYNCISCEDTEKVRKTRSTSRRETAIHDHNGKASEGVRYKPVELDTWKRQLLISSHRAMKSIIHAAEALGSITLFSFVCSIRFGKEIKRMWHLKNGERPSVHNHEDQM